MYQLHDITDDGLQPQRTALQPDEFNIRTALPMMNVVCSAFGQRESRFMTTIVAFRGATR